MGAVDWIIFGLNVACLAGSIIGAVTAFLSYKKCKQLTNFANLKISLDECQSIFDTSNKLLKLCGKNAYNKRGVNVEKEVMECGEAIQNSLDKIKEIVPSGSQEKIDEYLAKSPNQNFNIKTYVSTLVSANALKNNDLTVDNITELRDTVDKIQIHIKRMMENMQKSEKRL